MRINGRRGVRQIVPFIAFVYAFAGCGSSETTTGSVAASGGEVDETAFMNRFCDLYAPCCSAIEKKADTSACRQSSVLKDTAPAATRQFNPLFASQCLAELEALKDESSFCAAERTSANACSAVYSTSSGGTKTPGEACANDVECAPSSEGHVRCVDRTGNNANRVCTLTVVGKDGDGPCGANVNEGWTYLATQGPAKLYSCSIASGLRCRIDTNRCEQLGSAGAPCAVTSDCVLDAECDSATKTCVMLKGVGEACDTGFDCRQFTFCDPASHVCTAPQADGSACRVADECASRKCTSGTCTSDQLSFICQN